MQALWREAVRFGLVGSAGFVVDVGLFNLLRFAGNPGLLEHKPLTAKIISVSAATVVTYVGNRHWTWRHRERGAQHREALLFVIFSALALAIALACLGISHYAMGLRSPLADNISANVVGLVLGMVFRFWSYRTFVFTADGWTGSRLAGAEGRIAVSRPSDAGTRRTGRSPAPDAGPDLEYEESASG